MLIQAAEESFQKGLNALAQGSEREALAMFEAALELERRFGAGRPQARYLSFYGLCIGLQHTDLREGTRFCREAVTLEGYNPDIRCNLGRVLMRAGRRREAYVNFTKGLAMHPNHPGIRRALGMMGVRKRPVVPFLPRQHPINRLLGLVRLRMAAA